jgi:hypothetical protein
MEVIRNAYKILVGRHERHRRRCENNIKMDHKKGMSCGSDSNFSGYDPVASSSNTVINDDGCLPGC